MHAIKIGSCAAAAIAAVFCTASPAAAQVSGRRVDMLVRAQVAANCTIAAADSLPFGDVSSTRTAILRQGSIRVKCSNTTFYTVYISNGRDRLAGGSRRMRHLVTAGEYMEYQIYKAANHAQVWDAAGGVIVPGGSGGISQTGNGQEQTLTMYGRIAAGANIGTVGDYRDELTVTVVW